MDSCLHSLAYPALVLLAFLDTVHHNVDGMVFLLVQSASFGQFPDLPVQADGVDGLFQIARVEVVLGRTDVVVGLLDGDQPLPEVSFRVRVQAAGSGALYNYSEKRVTIPSTPSAAASIYP